MKEFVQEFRRVTRGSGYEERLIIEEFKRGMNSTVYQRLMELEQQPHSIEQQYNRAIILDRNQRESRREEKKLREQRDNRALAPRSNNVEASRQQLL